MSRSSGETGPSGVKGIRFDSQFSRIEELIRGNSFSREEISHLVDVLNSRLEPEPETSDVVDAKQVSLMSEFPSTPIAGKQQDFYGTAIGTFLERTDVQVGVGASPIDIARSYMASRTSDRAHGPYSFTLKGEMPQHGHEQNTLPQSCLPKASICWPGAVVQNNETYAKHQTPRGKFGIRDFPGTPYSRTILSKSTKLQAGSRGANTSTPFQSPQATSFGLVRSTDETVHGYGSVGPIRRIRNKFASDVRPRGSIFRSSSKGVISDTVKPNSSRDLLLNAEMNEEPGETSGTSKQRTEDNKSGISDGVFPKPDSSSSQAIKKILEHLDRTKPTPKEKEAELKLATSWRNSSVKENISSPLIGNLSSHRTPELGGLNFSTEFNRDSDESNYSLKLQEKGKNIPEDAGNENSKGFNSAFADSSGIPAANPISRFGFKGNSDPVVNRLHEGAVITTNDGSEGISSRFPLPHLSNGQVVRSVARPTGTETSKNNSTRPLLPLISVEKHDPRAISSDNGPGFTFPVSTSSSGFSEPPTPSINPSSSVSVLAQPQAATTVPSYEFGAKMSTPRLVFSHPSIDSASVSEASDLKFNFGSEDKTRLSFSSFTKDAICY